jgi:Transposase
MRHLEQKIDPAPKGLRWALLKDRSKLSHEQAADLDRLVAQFTTKRTARAWPYREQLLDILDRKQINVVSTMLKQWCTNVLRSKVDPMKAVAIMIRERDRKQVLKIIRQHAKDDQRMFVEVIDPLDPAWNVEEVKERVLEAAEYISPARLGTTDDCGLRPLVASALHGGSRVTPAWRRLNAPRGLLAWVRAPHIRRAAGPVGCSASKPNIIAR